MVAGLLSRVQSTVRLHRRRALVVVGVLLADAAVGLGATAAGSRAAGALVLLLLWPTLVAAVLLPRRVVAAQVGAVAVTSLAATLPALPGALLRTVVLTLSCAAMAYVVAGMRERLADTTQERLRLTRSDDLTGLANRRGVEELLPAMWNAATRRHEALTVLLLEVDQLDPIREEHGPQAGDAILVELAGFVRSLVRTEDIVARFAGTEVVVVTADPSTAGPADIGERLRRAVEQTTLSHDVTVSVGAVRYLPTDLDDPLPTFAGLLEDADQAIDAARRGGRNRVVGFSAPPLLIPPPRSATS